MQKRYSKKFFKEKGRSWWEGLTDKEKEEKRELNRIAALIRWGKYNPHQAKESN